MLPNIKKLREEKGMTQVELAKKVKISVRALSQYENKDSVPSYKVMIKILRVLGYKLVLEKIE
jgi:transcriptional regulator with XRE-family HTH domain